MNTLFDAIEVKSFIDKHAMKVCDAFVVAKSDFWLAAHYIIWLGDYDFIQISPYKHINRPLISEVAEMMKKFKRVKRFEGTEYERRQALQRALRIENEGRIYNLNAYNCEDFCNEIHTGKPQSKQVEIMTWGAGLAGVGLLGYGLSQKKGGAAFAGGLLLFLALAAAADRSSSQKRIPQYSY